MPDDPGLDYGRLMQKALRRVMAEALGHVAEHGLPGQHHFYITFDTAHPGVDMPDWLREQYPGELTIVIQHEYWDLAVLGDRFQVGLTFNDRFATLVIPFGAVQTFIDPSVKFGLKFDDHDGEEAEFPGGAGAEGAAPQGGQAAGEETRAGDGPAEGDSADVVSLDRFRKT